MKVLLDVDGTLIDFSDNPQESVLMLVRSLYTLGAYIYVSSGGGVDYASMVCRRLKIDHMVTKVLPKGQELKDYDFDISVDDEPTNWGKINLQVSKQKPLDLIDKMCNVCDGTGWLWD